MSRVKRGVTSHAKHKKVLKAAKGYFDAGSPGRVAHEKVSHSQCLPVHCTGRRNTCVSKTKASEVLHG